MAPKRLLKVFLQETHNSIVSPPEEGGTKDATEEEKNTVISDYCWKALILIRRI